MKIPTEIHMFPVGVGAWLVWADGYFRNEPMPTWASVLVLLAVWFLAYYASELKRRLLNAELALSNAGYELGGEGDWVLRDDRTSERIQ